MFVRSIRIALAAVSVAFIAACGGGGGGGTVPIGAIVSPTPASTSTPLVPQGMAMGDVKTLGHFSVRVPGITYDPDDKMLVFPYDHALYDANGNVRGVIPPAEPGTLYAIAYSHALHTFVAATQTTIYQLGLSSATTVLATGFGDIESIALDGGGKPYVVDGDHVATIANGKPFPLTAAGTIGSSTFISAVPQIAFDSADGALYVTNPGKDVVDRVTAGGTVSVFVGTCLVNPAQGVPCFPLNRGGTGASATFGTPAGLAYDAASNSFYMSDAYNNNLWNVSSAGAATQVAGYGPYAMVDGNGLRAFLSNPGVLAYGSDTGTIYMLQLSSYLTAYATTGSAPPAYVPPAQTFSLPSIPGNPAGLGVAPDGSAWLTQGTSNLVHLTSGGTSQLTLSGGVHAGSNIVFDRNGAMWMAASPFSMIPTAAGMLRVGADGTQTAFWAQDRPGGSSEVPEISSPAIGPDDNVWFGVGGSTASGVGKVDIGTSTLSQYWIYSGTQFPPGARAVARGSDGNLWVASGNGGGLQTKTPAAARVTPSGTVLTPLLPLTHQPIQMAFNPADGNVWYIDGVSTAGRISASGAETQITLQIACGLSCPTGAMNLAPAPDGSIWAAENNAGDIARIDTAGNVKRYLLPQFSSGGPELIGVRTDGKIWVVGGIGMAYLFDPSVYDSENYPHPTSALRAPKAATNGRFTLRSRGGVKLLPL